VKRDRTDIEPRRWMDDGATDDERLLLASWNPHEEPSARTREKIVGLVATGVTASAIGAVAARGAAAATGSAATAGATTGIAGIAGASALGASLAIGVIVTSMALGPRDPALGSRPGPNARGHAPVVASAAPASAAIAPLPPPSLSSVDPSVTEPAVTATSLATARTNAPSAKPASTPSAVPPLASAEVPVEVTPPPASSDAVSEAPATPRPRANVMGQVASLDRARAALAAGDAASALAVVDAHERTYPGGALAQEAAVLRIEALAKLGRRDEAAARARAFAEANPSSPHVAKVRSIVTP
jgi:hypothetical protein